MNNANDKQDKQHNNLTQHPQVKVLDKGYLMLVEHWGSDERIIEAARQSVGGGFVSWEPYEGHPKGDLGLLQFMYNGVPQHSGPWEFAGAVVEVLAPIAVYREWHRSRSQSYAEQSARYSPIPNFNYVPTVGRCFLGKDTKNKQAQAMKGADVLTIEAAEEWLKILDKGYENAERIYQDGLNKGIPKELARMIIPVGRYSRMRASVNLRNWLHFLGLRMDSNAQWEIRRYSFEVGSILEQLFPHTWKLFLENKPKILEAWTMFKEKGEVK